MVPLSSDTGSRELARRSDLHILRKVWHMMTGLTGLFVYFHWDIPQKSMALFLFYFGVIGILVDLIRIRLNGANQIILKILGPFMRESEKKGLSGLPFYSFGTSFSLYFFEENVAILSILFLVFADPVSSYVGILYGRLKITSNKSLEGTLAGFFTCFIITLFFSLFKESPITYIFLFSVTGGIVGALSEMFSLKVDDNLTIPVLSGFGLTFLNMAMPMW